MTRRARTLAATAALLLAHCAAVHSQVVSVFAQPSDRVVNPNHYAAQIQPIDESDPARSVARQAALGGTVILWMASKTDPHIVSKLPTYLAEAAKYQNITHVYIFDELYWDDHGFAFGKYEREVTAAAYLARSYGIKPLVTISPDVILHPAFQLDLHAFDGIAIDVYPSIRPSTPCLHGCSSGVNWIADLFYCSAQKLRAMGFKGQIGYIYQAFGLHSLPEAVLRQQLLEQRTAVDAAEAMGASAIMPWGLHLGAAELQREPDLYPLAGTRLERLVRP